MPVARTAPDRPRCHCGFELVPAPGRRGLCCPVHMPALRQTWRRRPRRRVLRRRPVPVPPPLAPRIVEVEVMIDDLETGQLGMVEA